MDVKTKAVSYTNALIIADWLENMEQDKLDVSSYMMGLNTIDFMSLIIPHAHENMEQDAFH